MFGHRHGQVPNNSNGFFALAALEAGIAAVEERSCFAVSQFSVSDEEMDPIACFDAAEDPPYKAVTLGLILALPLHARWREEGVLIVAADAEISLLQRGEQDQILVEPHNAGVPVAWIECRAKQWRDVFAHIFAP